MIPVAEHLEQVLSQVRPGREVTLPLDQAYGLVLARDVTSPVDLPRFENSAMDGYAVRAADVAAAGREHPVLIPVLGDIPAGDGERRVLAPGSAWRIMTGAPVPEGADAVVPVEDTDGHPREVQVRRSTEPGRHIRRAGEDLRAGQVVVPHGTRIGPGQVAALASAGVATVPVIGPVRVVVLSTGDELVPLGEPVGPGQITDSNGPMLVAAVRAAGYCALYRGRLPDDEGAIKREIRRHLGYADTVITTGGVSKGAYDAVKAVLSGEGTMTFSEVAMQPGKPQGFGVLGRRRVPVFTLPGNPVSTLISFEVFIRPALARIAGLRHRPTEVTAVVSRGWRSPEGKQQYSRVRLSRDPAGGFACEPSGGPGSHLVGGLALADGLAVVGPQTTEVSTGSSVRVIPLGPLDEIEARLEAESRGRTDGEARRDLGRGRGRHREEES